ncbi:hypothetical protein V1478_007388 [Vespula squamosa]|uniref:Uncharacterized protein n=1 Tax=Vespula squamosa TaxID=30214 RepID=A0ABD2B327_VESSQ
MRAKSDKQNTFHSTEFAGTKGVPRAIVREKGLGLTSKKEIIPSGLGHDDTYPVTLQPPGKSLLMRTIDTQYPDEKPPKPSSWLALRIQVPPLISELIGEKGSTRGRDKENEERKEEERKGKREGGREKVY